MGTTLDYRFGALTYVPIVAMLFLVPCLVDDYQARANDGSRNSSRRSPARQDTPRRRGLAAHCRANCTSGRICVRIEFSRCSSDRDLVLRSSL